MTDQWTIGGYQPGALGWSVRLHAEYYAEAAGFGCSFETKVAAEMADFLRRADRAGNGYWLARDAAGFVGTVAVDVEELDEGLVHLRWFIVEARARGHGLGRDLLGRAVAFGRDHGHPGLYLWTFESLQVAGRLYREHGFRLTRELKASQWGTAVTEQKYVLRF